MLWKICLLFIFNVVLPSSARSVPQEKDDCQGKSKHCGFQSCNPTKKGMLNIHLVPHSHDDVGWLKNVDQYYYGTKEYIQRANVQNILETSSQALMVDPSRRFIFVEMAFMHQWWNDKKEYKKKQVRELINQGQLEIALGAWSMADEAVTHYTALIEEHSRGFKFLKKNFGSCARPRTGWQVDPFGHSKEVAALFAQFGYDSMMFGRLDYQDKNNRMKMKTMEMLWRGSESLGKKANLFTAAMYNNYNYPAGLCWDEMCSQEPIVERKDKPDYNAEDYFIQFKNAADEQARVYATNHIIFTMGADFHYSNAERWFTNLDKLIKIVNDKQKEGSNLHALYSTPSCYIYSLNKQNKTWSEKTDDFFPYAHKRHAFWTGYYTSRAAFKRYVRESNNILQACKQVNVLAKLGQSDKVDDLWKEFSIVQHHDAITGTAKQQVDKDYRRRLAFGINSCQNVMRKAYKIWLSDKNKFYGKMEFCNQLNISSCHITETSDTFLVALYNPRAQSRTHWVRIPIKPTKAFKVLDAKDNKIPVQIIPITLETKMLPERHSLATHELVFLASLPPLGFTSYFVRQTNKELGDLLPVNGTFSDNIVENEYLKLELDGRTGRPLSITNKVKNIKLPFSADLKYYIASADYTQSSGAYIFRPTGSKLHEFPHTHGYILRGNYVTEVHVTYSSWAKLVIRLYEGAKTLEVEWTAGPLPLQNYEGTEIIVKYQTGVNNKGVIYTDANSRQMMKRQYDHRDTWNFHNTEPVAGNYYPITSRAYIKNDDDDIQFTVLTDRTQGGGSITNGSIELMLHRRTTRDDRLGVGEPLNETYDGQHGLIVRGKHWLYFDGVEESTYFHRQEGLDIYKEPILSFSKINRNRRSKLKLQVSALQNSLPPQVHLLTLEEYDPKNILIRLEHIYEKQEVSSEVSVDIKLILKDYNISGIKEMTLGGNIELKDINRLKWESDTQNSMEDEYADRKPIDGTLVVLKPMEIRTFMVKIQK
ncbi:lysosomal alpha-mannosidase-like [Argonauta hians]